LPPRRHHAATPRRPRSTDDLTRWDWASWNETSAGDAYAGVTGEVIWSEDAQEGYMVLEGMPTNDPSAEQYQLWVIESSRGVPLEVPPVDGGVFDVDDVGKVVIPIRAALPATEVVAFAVTVERPGGVVVSDQARRAVIAVDPEQDEA
ncbi:MAG: anti-sigma factor, partial [Planctomycetota bacterium]